MRGAPPLFHLFRPSFNSTLFTTPSLHYIMSGSHPGFVGKCVLAPMVRTGELPTRLVALKYGADAVWGMCVQF
jgi:hypothetical protein